MANSRRPQVPRRLVTEAEALRDTLNTIFKNQGLKREVSRNSVFEAGADIFQNMRFQIVDFQKPVGPRKVTRIVAEVKTRKVKRK